MSMPAFEVAYYEDESLRRALVTDALTKADGRVLPVESLRRVPPHADILLVGASDIVSALGPLTALSEDNPQLQILLLWEADDPALMLAALRAGVRDIVGTPRAACQAVQRAWSRRVKVATVPAAAPSRPGRIVAVFALKGGVGKSILATNLAISLARQCEAPTTLVDLSMPFGNLDMYLDIDAPRGVSDILPLGSDLDQRTVQQALTRHVSGVHLLAGHKLGAVESFAHQPSAALFDTLTQTRGLTVVDIGAFLDEAQVGALEAADLILVPVTPLISSVVAMPAIWEHLASLGIAGDRIMPVLNQTRPEGDSLPEHVLHQLLRGKPRFQIGWGGPEVERSLNEGRPLSHFNRKCAYTKALDLLADDVLARVSLPSAAPTPVFSLRALARRSAVGAAGGLVSLFQKRESAHVHA